MMASQRNESDSNRGFGARYSLQQEDSLPNGAPSSLDSDLLSDPSRLISIILNGTSNRGIPTTQRRERELAYAHLTQEELLNKLIDREYEAQRLSKILRAVVQRLNSQTTRITDLERDGQEALERLRQINQSRIEAQQDASRVDQELQLYRSELENSRRELVRVADLLRTSQEQREDAEQAAARARERARKLRQQRLVDAAREEGRRWGFQDGFGRAKETFAISNDMQAALSGATQTYLQGNSRIEGLEQADNEETSVRSLTPEIIQQTEVRPPSAHSESAVLHNPFTERSRHSSTLHRPTHPPEPVAQELRPSSEPPANVPPVSAGSVHPNDLDANTPAISVFHVDLADARRESGLGFNDRHKYSRSSRPARPHSAEFDVPLPTHGNSNPRQDVPPNRAGHNHKQVAQRPALTPQDERKKVSWYRSFSFRNKFGKRRVIDPDPTQEAQTGNAEEPYTDPDEDVMYRNVPEQPVPWYRTKGTPAGPRSSKRLSSSFSSVSTHMSQLQLINTPAPLLSREINASGGSLSIRSGKDASMLGRLKEKESLLSVIKEDPMSREHTPRTDRFAPNAVGSRMPGVPRYPSSSTMNSQMMRRPIVLSDSSRPQFPPTPGVDSFSGRHRSVTPPVTIQVQTPSHTRTSSANPPVDDILPNSFLSPSSATQPLPSPSRVDHFQTNSRVSNSHFAEMPVQDHKPSRQTSAMNIKETYLSRSADMDRPMSSPGSSRVQERHEPAWPSSSRHSARIASTPVGRDTEVPGSPGGLNRETFARNASSVSVRTLGSYARFDPETYVDPAFFKPNAEERHQLRDVPPRPASSASGLSYVTEKR